MVLSGFRPMVLVSMAGEYSGFPGSALNSLLLFPCFLAVSETVVFPFILNGKGYARFKKKNVSTSPSFFDGITISVKGPTNR